MGRSRCALFARCPHVALSQRCTSICPVSCLSRSPLLAGHNTSTGSQWEAMRITRLAGHIAYDHYQAAQGLPALTHRSVPLTEIACIGMNPLEDGWFLFSNGASRRWIWASTTSALRPRPSFLVLQIYHAPRGASHNVSRRGTQCRPEIDRQADRQG